ncbi:hypothetical protein CONPUDRAFT_146091 [Coniophora puteana RWD-64-598 SS2]|uniref:Uncharacterized protein n=1 Tax=Coniophora puteana (strain RWD-64-598) TaxID=741705 RepID=A0A5M3MFN8_CONPW|nr:uncharacterized protein CONPUDRAFT_146091 [Coniophora puteana RWD-64-598 SS2]EIW78032.1 hypothetical protein CONPUDRAFT_146091 [Coniophora puteana RWD-64-598 SS2]
MSTTLSQVNDTIIAYQQSSYCIGFLSATIAAIVIYDWSLTLGRETDRVWCRYLSIVIIFCYHLSIIHYGTGLSQFYSWSNCIVYIASDAIMVFRIHAMFPKSKPILALILVAFIGVIVVNIVGYIPASENKEEDESLQLMRLCVESNLWNYKTFVSMTRVPRVVFEALLLSLALGGYYRHAAERRKNIGIWSVNAWIKLLMEQSIVYFAVAVGCDTIIIASGYSSQENMTSFGAILASLQGYLLAPRLLLSFRGHQSKPMHSRDNSADSTLSFIKHARTPSDMLYQLPTIARASMVSSLAK